MVKVELSKIKRVLIIRPGAIGDVLLTTPFIRALKKALPDAVIDYVAAPFPAKILEGNPYLSNVTVFDKNRYKSANFIVKAFNDFKFYTALAGNKYDLVFDLFGNLRSALMAFLSGARYRAGFTFRIRKYLYNIKVKPAQDPMYNVHYHTQLLTAIGIPEDGEELDFIIPEAEKAKAAQFINTVKSGGPVIGINPSGTWPTKRWPEEKFGELAGLILNGIKKSSVIVLWGPGEQHMAEKVLKNCPVKQGIIIAPQTSLKELAALIGQMDVLVTNDGAPKHIAVAMKTPAVTVFGPTNSISWNPRDNPYYPAVASALSCAPCDKTQCPDRDIECMKKISAADVFEAVKNTAALKSRV
ncbi:MAG: glycosyltransferase family 9 protein [Candidatus Goldbacteria bacterium]|nr:glycosyltransferase family 9 protein [Candidatus Goldiibacteriota bacterium]